MSKEIIEMFKQVEKLKNIDHDELLHAFERGISTAAKKVYGIKPDIKVELSDKEIKFLWRKKVVEKVNNEYIEINIDEAKKVKEDAKIGDEIYVLFYPKDFVRIAAQITKQVITQKIKEAEKEQIYQEYKQKEGEVVTGVVHTIEKNGDIIVDLGIVEGVLRKREQVSTEKFKIGDRIRGYVLKTNKSKNGAKLELTRTHPNFVKKIFEMEVTEIEQGIVEVVYVAREPGIKTKVVVKSKDSHVDPVGACIGVKGSRIQTIIKELQGEKIDVVLYSDDIKEFLKSAIAPIEIQNIYIDEKYKYAILSVRDEQFSQVIGKEGINMRLVAKITKWKVSVLRDSEFTEEKVKSMLNSFYEQMKYDLFKLSENISVKQLKRLKNTGIKNLKDFINADDEKIIEILNKNKEFVKTMKEKAKELIKEEDNQKQ